MKVQNIFMTSLLVCQTKCLTMLKKEGWYFIKHKGERLLQNP